jgi:hypothetical protein
MKRHSLYLLTALTFAACAEPTSAPMDARFAKAPPSGPTNTSAGVTLLPSGTSVATSIISAGDNLGEYRDGICGVTATLFYAGSNDMIMDTDNPAAKDRKCVGKPAGSYPRKINVTINGSTYAGGGLNVLSAGTVSVGTTANRQVGVVLAAGGPCVRVQFNIADGGLPVTRLSATSYSVSGSGTARCVDSSGGYTTFATPMAVSATFNSY